MRPTFPLAALVVAAAVPGAFAQAPTAIPPVPAQRTPPSFAAERDGRRLLFDLRDRARAAAPTAVVARVVRMTSQGPEAPPTVVRWSETLRRDPERERFALTVESSAGGGTSVRKVIRDGESVMGTLFESKAGASRRGVQRSAVVRDETRWDDICAAHGVSAESQAVRLALFPRFAPEGPVWRDGSGAVVEVVAPIRRNAPERIRRWTADPRTRSLSRFEEWTIAKGNPRPARGKRPADDGVRVTYVLETVTAAPRSAAAFSMALPPGYQEAPTPASPGPPPPSPIDASARPLIAAWRRAWERPLAIAATVEVSWEVEQRVAGTRDGRRLPEPYRAQLWLRRPGRARIEGVGGNRRETTAAVADGTRARVRRVVDGVDPERPWKALVQAGATDSNAFLDWFFDGPPTFEGAEYVRAAGTGVSASGEPLRLLEVRSVRESGGGGGRKATTIFQAVIGLGEDGLPREVRTLTRTEVQDLTEADQPLAVQQTVRWRDVYRDAETSPSRFQLD